MRLTPRGRRLALTAHITASVGWFGAVAAFLGLAVAALVSSDPERVRAIYRTMEVTGWFVLVPFAAASLGTGLVQSLGTKWGLFRHYWVLAKLVINLFATVVLLMYMQTLESLAASAVAKSAPGDLELKTASPAVHAGGALVLLSVAIVLAVYKPTGSTRYGQRKLSRERRRTRLEPHQRAPSARS